MRSTAAKRAINYAQWSIAAHSEKQFMLEIELSSVHFNTSLKMGYRHIGFMG